MTYTLTGDCPRCGGYLSARERNRDGALFIGCSGYPSCRFTAPYDPHLQDLVRENDSLRARLEAHAPAAPDELRRAVREVLVNFHPDKHPSGTVDATEVAQALTWLLSVADGKAKRRRGAA